MPQLLVNQNTVFKKAAVDSSKLGSAEKVGVEKGTLLEIHSYSPIINSHIRVAFKTANFGGSNTWYCYTKHVSIIGNLPDNQPKDTPPANPPSGKTISIPGITGPVAVAASIIYDGNFSWSEATKGGTRIPTNGAEVGQIIKIARTMEQVRTRLGDRSITVTSWFRPRHINKAVGGASGSRHILGDAVDFTVSGLSSMQAYHAINGWHGNSGGLAYSVGGGFVHIDLRNYSARWRYDS